jgi:hypothetical protein
MSDVLGAEAFRARCFELQAARDVATTQEDRKRQQWLLDAAVQDLITVEAWERKARQ